MSKKIYSIISIIISTIILIFSIQNRVYASSATMSASATNVELGTTVTISANIKSSASWALDVSTTGGTLNKNDSRVGNTDSGNNEDKKITLGTFVANSEGTYKITLSGYVVDGNSFSKTNINETISITVKKKEQPKPEPEIPSTPTTTPEPEKPATNNNTPTETKKSSEARLSNLGINPNDFKGFKSSKTEYNVEVPNNVSSVEIYATAAKNGKVTGDGAVTLKEGANKFEVKVTSEDGNNSKIYTLTINRKTAAEQTKEDGEARLKSLGIKPEEYDFTGFDSEKTEYSVEVPNEVEEIEVYATAMNSSAQITGTGMITLKEGLNELKIESIAADGTKKTYILNVTRKEAEETTATTEKIFGLSALEIQGLKLTPSFKQGIYEYTAELTDVTVGSSLNITTKTNDEDAIVEIIGNENLQDGENIITILVKNEETGENTTYQITVNKNIIVEEVVEQTSWLKPSTWGKEEIIKIAIIVVLIILIIIAIILKMKIAKEGKEQRNLPGAEELDKAIAEHQELSEESNYEEVVENNFKNKYAPENEGEQNYIEEIAMSKFGMNEGNEDVEVKPKRRGRHF